jgi:hypothetical protein
MTKRVMVVNYSNGRILRSIEQHGLSGRVKLLAHGDSWFGFPFPLAGGSRNLIDALSTRKKTVAIDIAISGDTAENMSQGDRLAQYTRILNGEMDSDAIAVSAILLSAGGNDLIMRIGDLVQTAARQVRRAAGRAMTRELRAEIHAKALEKLEQPSAKQIYDDVIENLVELIDVRDNGPNAASPVILHGYCYPTPRDAPAVSFPIKVGPWIWSRLSPLGYTQAQQQQIAKNVIDEFNTRLLAIEDKARGVHVLDLRPLQQPGGPLPVASPEDLEPTTYWHDEIHLNSAGWDTVTSRTFDPLLDSLI